MTNICELKDMFHGETLLVVSCGPSAKQWEKVYRDLEICRIAAVKQAIDLVNSSADIHFFNPYNISCFKYQSHKTIRIFTNDETKKPVFSGFDYEFMVRKQPVNPYHGMISKTCAFSEHTIDKTGAIRPWGPGIMLETVLYCSIYMGFKKIVTVGWDIADSQSSNLHFYDKEAIKYDQLHALPSQNCRNIDPFLYNYLRHAAGLRYNIIRPFKGEASIVSSCLSALKSFIVDDCGVEFVCISDSEWTKPLRY